MRIAKIVKSNSHVDYVGRVIDRLEAARIAWGPKEYKTTFRALWDDTGLYVNFTARDPDPWSTMTKRDEWLWQEEVVEIFLDLDRSGRNYAEVEVSPANVICDVRMVSPSPHKQMDYAWNLDGLESRVRVRRKPGKPTSWIVTDRGSSAVANSVAGA